MDEEPGSDRISPRSPLGSLSVREICALPLFADADVIAGAGGLDRRVRRLNVMTVPDIARWTKEHELLLTTGYPLPKTSEALIGLLVELNDRGVSALGVKYGDYGPGLADDVLRAADELSFPIIEIPEPVHFDDVLSQVLSDITNRQAAALARAQEIHEGLLRIVLSGGGLDEIVRQLGSVLGASVFYVDPAGRVPASVADPAHRDRLVRLGVLDAADALAVNRLPGSDSELASASISAAMAPVLAGAFRHGHLLAVAGAGELPQEAEVLVEQSAMVAALEITKRHAVRAAERHFESSALHELLTGGGDDVGDVLARSGSFGWRLDRPLLVLVARRDGPALVGVDYEARHEHDIDAWVGTVRNLDRGAAAAGLGRDLVAVCGVAGGPESVAGLLAKGVSGTTRSSFSIGVSGPVAEPSRLAGGYQQARTALDIAQKVIGPGAVAPYESLGLFRLLHSVSDRGALRSFVDDALGAVLTRPAAERDDLLRTLDVLLDQHLNVAETARLLHFHYNTMRYRIRKLRQLVGPFFEDGDLRLRLALALRILRMWELSPPAQR